MRLKEHEYDIVDEAINDGSVGIFITKEALERWRDHYREVARKGKDEDGGTSLKGRFFLGKLDAIIDILKHFEEE